MKKNQKAFWKKFAHVFTLIAMISALVLGIFFSSIKTSSLLGFGPELDGVYRASVQVIKNNSNSTISDEEIAQGLQDKLSPFSDVDIKVKFSGKEHLTVEVGKSTYKSSNDQGRRSQFRNAIQSTGGMFVLTYDDKDFQDLYTNKEAVGAVNGANERINGDDLFSNRLDVQSLQTREGRAPYVSLSLKENDNGGFVLADILSKVNGDDNQQQKRFNFITDLEDTINQVKNLYQNDDAIHVFYDNVIKVAQQYINDSETSRTDREILRDIFSGTVQWVVPGTGGFTRDAKISLIDNKFENVTVTVQDANGNRRDIDGINNEKDLRDILLRDPNRKERGGNFEANPRDLDYYMYSSNAKGSDLSKDQRTSWLLNESYNLGTIEDTFKTITNFFLKKVILNLDQTSRSIDGTFAINSEIDQMLPIIKDRFVFNGTLMPMNEEGSIPITSLTANPGIGFLTKEIQNGNSGSIPSGLYVRTASQTSGRKAIASIKQNALGITYHVESIRFIEPTIGKTWFIISIIFLSVIMLLLIIYLLFVYRLLGLFTIIIAVTTASLLMVFAVIFGIPLGSQLIMGLFLVIGLTIDLSLILFDSFTNKLYEQKQAVKTAFKIANKETIALSIDAIIIALIPNVIMFWVAEGALKNFATIATIGVFTALLFGVAVLRFGSWLILKLKSVQNNQVLLPIDTNFVLKLSLKEQYLVHKYQNYLEKVEGKDKYSSKELLKMKHATESLATLNQSLDAKRLENIEKLKVQDQKEVVKLNKQIARLEKRKQGWYTTHLKVLGLNQKIRSHYDLKIDQIKSIMDTETFDDKTPAEKRSISRKVRILKTERNFNRTGIIISIAFLLFSALAGIIGATVGPNWGPGFGQGNEFVVYGQEVEDTYNSTIGSQRPSSWREDPNKQKLNDKAQEIADENQQAMTSLKEKITEARNRGQNRDAEDLEKQLYSFEAQQVIQFYKFIINNNLYTNVNSSASDINLQTWDISFVDNYVFTDTKNQVTTNNAKHIAISITSTSTNRTSRINFRRTLSYLAVPGSNPWNASTKRDHRNDTGGIVAYEEAPYTTINLVKEILIVFGILIAALIVYIVIRFKWTYYVALALGLGLTFLTTVAAVIIFRIPVTAELLSGFALLISFVLLTMVFILGKGKSILTVDDKKELNSKFNDEIEQSVLIRQKKKDLNETVEPIIRELKANKKKIKRLQKQIKKGEDVDFEKLEKLNERQVHLKAKKKALVKENKVEYTAFKKEAKNKIKILSRKNFFFKEIYMQLIRFSFKRILTIGLFYILTAIILLTTLAPMFGLGLVVLIGIVVGFVVTLFVVIPLWILLERYRLRNVSGFKVFMNNIEVSQEEQIVVDVND